MDTLKDYVVQYNHLSVPTPDSNLEKQILVEMCKSAADTVLRQCGREYGFGPESRLRATDISKLSLEERKGLETSNIISERELGIFTTDRKVDSVYLSVPVNHAA